MCSLKPARSNSLTVASWRLPFGSPRRRTGVGGGPGRSVRAASAARRGVPGCCERVTREVRLVVIGNVWYCPTGRQARIVPVRRSILPQGSAECQLTGPVRERYNTPLMFKRVMHSIQARRRTAWVIAAILILPFIFFLQGSWHTPRAGPGGTAGRVFGRAVPWDEFQSQRFWVRRQFVNRLGPNLPPTLETLVTQYTWERLMLLAEADREELRVTDQDVAALLQTLPVFQNSGRFMPERYYQFVGALGLTPRRFEELIRQDLVVERLLGNIKTDVTVTDEDARAAFLDAYEQVRVALLRIAPETFREAVGRELTNEALRAAYDAAPETWRVPANVTFRYAGRTLEESKAAAEVSEEDIADEYAAHRDEFVAEDGAPVPLDDVREALRARLTERRAARDLVTLAMVLEDDLAAARPFAEIAQTRGLSPQTVGPWAVTDDWPPGLPEHDVLDVMAAAAPGAPPQLVETDLGVYAAELLERTVERLPAFEEVREDVRDHVIMTRAREAARAAADALHGQLAQTLESGTAFEAACRDVGAAPILPAPFTRHDPVESLGPAAFVTETAFATPVGELSPVIETPEGWALVFVQERVPADPAAFTEEAQGTWRDQVRAEREQQRLAEWLRQVRERAKLESFLDNLAEEG